MEERRSLSVLVDNEAGVLSQVSRLFSRKGYNIESLAVGTTSDPKVSRITIEVLADQRHAELLCNQLRKLLPVHSVKLLRPDNSLRREMILMELRLHPRHRGPVTGSCRWQAFSARRSLTVSPSTLTIAMIGEESKVEAIVGLVKELGILELVRTGMVALERGTDTIYESTKEKGEFDYGKNVL